MANDIKFYYHAQAWATAFSGNNSSIVLDTDGSVFKDSISFGNLVVSYDGIVGAAGFPQQGQITIFANSHEGTTPGLIHSVIESESTSYNIAGGVLDTTDWHHFILKIDNANRLITLKIDNVVVQTINMTDNMRLFNKLQNVVLFRYLNEGATHDRYRGKLDDFRVYSFITNDQEDEDVYDWGNQKLQFENRILIPPKEVCRGRVASFKLESNDYMQVRNLAIEYNAINMR